VALHITVGLCEPAGAFSAGCGLGGTGVHTKPVLCAVRPGVVVGARRTRAWGNVFQSIKPERFSRDPRL
jgi:hypothetical protein